MADVNAIPGYRLLRVLGKGGMAAVYLAHQDSVDREVAIKLMSRHLLVDPRFGERFLREARIAAKLHHRNVVSIYDVGVHDEQPYIAMEFLSGGPVMPHENTPLELAPTLRCIREIAMALDYAHSKGYIHRDVKPDNILLRDDGSSVLSDFGIARAVDGATMMTKTGAVVGTPFYMSPEQLRGREVDGRADLYSLGVVCYQLLSGKVPYTASDSLAIGIMHMTAPMPTLPKKYQWLQPLLETMLAKDPGDRVQTGAELAEMVTRAERDGEQPIIIRPSPPPPLPVAPPHPEAPPPTRRMGTGAMSAARESYENAAAELSDLRAEPRAGRPPAREEQASERRIPAAAPRAEPRFGELDPSVASAVERRPQGSAKRAARWPWLILVLVLLAGSGWWFRPLLLEQWSRFAEASEAPGQAPVPRSDARLREARVAKENGRVKTSESGLARSGTVDRSPDADADALLSGALEAERAGRWLGADGALVGYRAALKRASNNTAAKRGVALIEEKLSAELGAAINANERENVEAKLSLWRAAAPDSRALAEVESQWQKRKLAQSNSLSEVSTLLNQAEAALAAGQLISPAETSALARYRQVLRSEPNNAVAKAGLKRIADALLIQADIALDEGRGDMATRLLSQARQLGASGSAVSALQEKLEDLRKPAVVELSPERRAQLQTLLERMDSALDAGQLLEPLGSSAYDLLKRLQDLERAAPEVVTRAARLRSALKENLELALSSGEFEDAVNALVSLPNLGPDPENAKLRDRLAEALVSDVRIKISAGEREAAARRLNLLKQIKPKHPEIAELSSELLSSS